MLILGRKPGEYLMIGDEIIVKVIRTQEGLKLAVQAPKDVPVIRGEVYEQEHPRPAAVKDSLANGTKKRILKTEKRADSREIIAGELR